MTPGGLHVYRKARDRSSNTWCLTPELYAAKPDYVQSLADFVRSRPAQSVESFVQQSNAVIAHDAEAQLARITAPTLITFGRHDVATSTQSEYWRLGAATDAIPLPEPKPRAVREHIVVPSICCRDVACAGWSNVRRFEHFL
jgi:pimeloyl-ACP methyl ester carboxylesterase